VYTITFLPSVEKEALGDELFVLLVSACWLQAISVSKLTPVINFFIAANFWLEPVLIKILPIIYTKK
jgi:hypothetical protein